MLFDKLDDPASALSFSGTLLQPEEVVAGVRKVLDKPRPVTCLPWHRGVVSRIADALPSLAVRIGPMIVAQGRRTQQKLLASGGPQRKV